MQQRCDGYMYQNKVVHLVGISEKRLISTMELGSLACPPTQDKNVYEHSQNAVKTSGVCQVSHFVWQIVMGSIQTVQNLLLKK